MKINGATILSTLSTTTNYVLKQSSTVGTLDNSQIFDDGTNVGIGTTSPTTALYVSKAGTGSFNVLTLQNSQARGANVGVRLNFQANSDFSGSDSGGAISVINTSGTNQNSCDLLFETGTLGISTEKMRITSAGNVEIKKSDSRLLGGDASGRLIVSNSDTSAYVSINGSSNATPNNIGIITNSEITFNTGASYSERMRITSGGNVGIGTTDVDSRLKVELINIASLRVAYNGTSVNYYDANENIFRSGSGTERMRITTSGNVGIGTSSPDASALLDVSSTTQGFLPPRMTTSERDAISSPASGLMIWNTDNRQIEVFSVSVWVGL